MISDPQGLVTVPTTDHLTDVMCWLVDPDGGALRMDQAIDIARAIARGEVPHVAMRCPVMTTDGGKTWTRIEEDRHKTFATVTVPAGIASVDDAIVISTAVGKSK